MFDQARNAQSPKEASISFSVRKKSFARPARAAGAGDPSHDGLALAVHEGAPGAFEALVRAYQDALLGYASRLVGDRFAAQEVTQDAFLRAHRALTAVYDAERCRTLNLRPWLFRIARNLSLNRLRADRAGDADPLPDGDGWHEPALRRGPDPDADLEAKDEAARLERALSRLPGSTRELVLLRFVEDMPFAEIAAILGGSEASARGKVFRALRQLRATLNDEEVTHAL